MSIIVKKWRKVVGCSAKNNRESLIENDFLAPTEFVYNRVEKSPIRQQSTEDADFRVYNEYDNLEHINQPANSNSNPKRKTELKDSTNVNYARGFKRFFQSKSVDKCDAAETTGDGLTKNPSYSNKEGVENDQCTACILNQEPVYCEIQDLSSLCSDSHPLIDLKQNQFRNSRMTDSKVNLFVKGENDEPQQKEAMEATSTDLTEIRSIESFETRSDAIFWYMNLLHDRMIECVQQERALNTNEQVKRTNVIDAHLLYSRNYYQMKTRAATTSVDAMSRLDRVHPCLVALACFFDSDAVRVVDSHTCACDSYLYIFSTRVKFCAWKTKLFVILKRPKRSSIERLNLIEDLMNCRKIFNNQ